MEDFRYFCRNKDNNRNPEHSDYKTCKYKYGTQKDFTYTEESR